MKNSDFGNPASMDLKQMVEQLDEYQKELEEKGFVSAQDGTILQQVRTDFGQVNFVFNPQFQKEFFNNSFLKCLAAINGLPTTIEEVRKFVRLPEEAKIVEAELEIKDPELLAQVEVLAENAIRYFFDNLDEFFHFAAQNYVEEAFIQTALKSGNGNYYKIEASEIEAYKKLVAVRNESERKRMNINKATGNKAVWTAEKLKDLLARYEELLPIIREAKQLYRQIKENPRWQKVLMAAHPNLSETIIKRISFSGKSSEPASLAMEAATEALGETFNDYTKTLLVKARRNREIK